MQSNDCDILIVGAGPAGLATAWKLSQLGHRRILLIERGPSLFRRGCPVLRTGHCPVCRRCDLLSGVGGASGMLGGKLCFFPAGQRLSDHLNVTSEEANDRVAQFLAQSGFSKVEELLYHPSAGRQLSIGDELTLKEYDSLPLLRVDIQSMFGSIVGVIEAAGVLTTVKTEVTAVDRRANEGFVVTATTNGVENKIRVLDSIVLACGRGMPRWLTKLTAHLGIAKRPTTVDVGVRLEVPGPSVSGIFSALEDPKLKLHAETSSEVRTLCWCRGGEMSVTSIDGMRLVDGHFGDNWKSNTSVSLVARLQVNPDLDPWDHAVHQFSREMLAAAPVYQQLVQFLCMNIASSSDETFSPLPYSCQEFDIRASLNESVRGRICEMITRLDSLANGDLLRTANGRVFAPVIDNHWEEPLLDDSLMTSCPGVYMAGDVTGLGRGIVQAFFAGLNVADAVTRKAGISRASWAEK